jgi:oxygen-independent coproporphyrinogen-3 oxidase
MTPALLQKYSVPVPRYTSYPPANFFNEAYTAADYQKAIIASNEEEPANISVYIHIPFCFQLCYYCGCNAILLTNKKDVSSYIDAVKKEIRMTLPLLSKERKIAQIHYGGGTPTTQPIEVLNELNQMILSEFDCIEHPEIAIEVHPGYMDANYWRGLSEIGFTRVSLGIQDFKEDVLRCVRRKSPRLPIEEIMQILRDAGLSVNMDFIYGLPKQDVSSFTATMEKAASLHPDRIVTFSYAHVPWVNALQKHLEDAGLPDSAQKSELFSTATRILSTAGYCPLGMDHFVLPTDELYEAAQSHRLHRNFQGYCSRRTTGQVYAFGMTGISQLSSSYSQNVKDLHTYIYRVNQGQFPVGKGYVLNREERITREVIDTLMCNYALRWADAADRLKLSTDEVKAAVNYNEQTLGEFATDGIISFSPDEIIIRPDAKPFVRNVAASLDKLMIHTDKKFSNVG